MSPFDINLVVFHFDDFNYGRRSQPYFFLTIATQLGFFHNIIFLEDKHKILLHLSILYEYQQFFQHRICFSIQPQLQLVNLHRNRKYFVIKLHTWFCLSYFLKTNKILQHLSIFYEYQQFFQHRICFTIQSPNYSDP